MINTKKHFSNRYLVHLIIPLAVSTLLASTVGIADTLMISSALDKASVSGVSLVDQITVLIINIFAALATGGAVVTSQFLGAERYEKAEESAKQLLLSAGVVSVLIGAAFVVFCRNILNLCYPEIDAETNRAAVTYLFITAFSYPFIAVENCCGALFRSFGKSNYCMYSAIVCNIVNIVGNALTIYVFKWGITGAAISTTFGRFIGMALMLIWISSKNSPVRINIFKRIIPDFGMIKKILGIGIPSGLENGIFQLGRLLVVTIIANYGLIQTTANAVANNLDAFGCIFGSSMNLAVITVIGQCVGAHDFEGVKYYAKKLLAIEYIIGALFYSSTLVFITPILGWYNLDAETAQLTRTLVFIHNGIGMFLWPLSFTLPNFLRAANDVRFAMTVSVVSMILCRLGLSYFFHYTFGMGALGVWIAMVVDWIFRISFFVFRFLSGKWKKYCT